MGVSVGHVKNVTVADGTNANIVRPSDWNSAHAVTLNLSGTDIIGAFSNDGNVTFGTNTAGYVTGTVNVAGGGAGTGFTGTNATGTLDSNGLALSVALGGGGGAAISAGANSQNTGTVIFSNASGVSFGLNAGTLTASVKTDYLTTAQPPGAYLTTARASNDAVGLNTAATNVTWTVNSSGISLNAGAYLTTAMASNASSLFAATGFTTTSVAGAVVAGTHDTAGLKLAVPSYLTTAQPVGAYLTTARASNDAVGLNTALTAGPLAWTVNSSGISLNAGSAAGTSTGFAGANISGSMTHNTAGLNLSLSVNPGGAVTDSWSGSGNTFGTSSGTATQWAFQGSDAVSVAVNNGTVIIKAPSAAAGNVTFSAGTSSAGIGSVVFSNSNGVSFGLNGSTITGSVSTGAGYTALTFQNRQLGASTTLNSMGGQNSLWLVPARIVVPVSASTILAAMISYSGTNTSAATAQFGQTLRAGIWSQHTDPASTTQFGQYWTGNASMTFWNSGTSSGSYAYSLAGGQTTSSSAGSNLLTASIMGARLIVMPIGSTMTTGLYVFGIVNSTSSAGYSAAMSRAALYMDNPLSIGMGTFGQATNASIGYNDGGTYSATTGALPSTLALSEIRGVNNVMPYFKVGAV